jgi:hypothetical protein
MSFSTKYVYDLVDKLSPQLKKIQNNVANSSSSIRRSTDKMASSFKKVGHNLDKLAKKSRDVGKSLFIKATLPIALLAGSFVKAASDYQESINKVDVAFGKASGSVKKFAVAAGSDFGIDRGAALDMAAMFGDMGTGMGITQDKAATLATSLVGLAGDISSFKNIGIAQSQTALASIFTGETESLKKLGIVMTETNLQEFARSQGMRRKVKDMKQAEKVMLRYNFVMAMSKNAVGDFKRTQEGFANQLRGLQTAFKDLSIVMGTILLPFATKLVNKLRLLIERFTALSPRTQKIILIVAGLVAVLAPLLIAFSFMIPALVAIGAGFVFLASPIGLIIIAVAALSAAFIYLWDDLKIIYNFLKDTFVKVFDNIADKVNYVIDIISNLKNMIPDLGSLGEKLGFGDSNVNNQIINSQEINAAQQSIVGGQLDINFANMPKGTNTNYTPAPQSVMNVGTSSIWAQ